jgi:hypothetical protein
VENLIKKQFDYHITGSTLYEIAFIYYFTLGFLQTSTFTEYFPNNTFHYLSFVSLGLILFKLFFLDEQKIKTFIFNLAILFLLVITWRTSQNFDLLPMGFFIIGARNVNFSKLIKLYFVVGTVILAFIMFSSSLGLIKDLIYYRGTTSIVRESFGIVYPTDFAAHVLFIVLAFVYTYFDSLSYKSYFLFVLIAFFLIKFCDARLNALAILLIIPVVWIGRRAKRGKIVSKCVASFYWMVPIVTAYVTILFVIFFNDKNKFMHEANLLTSGRLVLGNKAYEGYGFSLFGKQVIEHGWGGLHGFSMLKNNPEKYFYIDSSYLRIIIMYGIIIFTLIMITMTVISWRSVHYGQFVLASIMVIVSLSAIVEQRLIDMSYDPFLISLFSLMNYRQNEEEKP